ncbi:unnamed protein product [Schistocephalus solidus]|uniref:14_3_3 domain-containing protein n=1 Tax=Schistocephalus solidus TaxID=70667 RepID=A0A183T0B4_SCHSO|nr:unnamed protein product [Schistocephalus solidus]
MTLTDYLNQSSPALSDLQFIALNMCSLVSTAWLEGLPVKDRTSLLALARCLEQAERYDDMAVVMKEVAERDPDLSNEERNLLSVAYKNVVGSRRNSHRLLLGKMSRSQDPDRLQLTKEYLEDLHKELNSICDDVLDKLLPACNTHEGKVFYHKMMGDYYRYKAENAKGNDHKEVVDASLAAYEEATQIANANLEPTHPIRLGLALNYSVFYYEIKNDPEKACHLAKTAFDDAISESGSQCDETYKDSTLIMQLLRDNLASLTSRDCGDFCWRNVMVTVV